MFSWIRTSLLILVLTSFLLASCNPQEGIQVHSPWMMPAVQGENALVYFRLFNHTSEGDLLMSVSSDAADAAQLDESTFTGDLAQISPVDHILLPASTEVNFGSDVLHVMLLGLKQDLHLRDEIEIVLHFLHSPDLIINVSVRSFPPPSESEEHH